MLKIGELSKICQVNIQTLRYYDRIGLLCADRVDDESGYRYYAPEKVLVYQTIVHLKSLDFSLEEIKEFLQVSHEKQLVMYRNKKQEILASVQEKRDILQKIDDSCKNAGAGYLSLNEQILKIPFENDPAVVGKWVYCGNMDRKQKFTESDILQKRDVLQKNLYFLPGGSPVWGYFWSKGNLYIMMPDYNVVVPNPYQIVTCGTNVYMTVDFVAERFYSSDDTTVRIYRQVDTAIRTERETYEFRDDVNLPFVPDRHVIGEWEAVDFLMTSDAFTADPSRWRKKLWIRGLQFHERGICMKLMAGGKRMCQYTTGVIMDVENETAEHYIFRQENGTEYLIAEHKSGDYSYNGEIQYYVFRRKI